MARPYRELRDKMSAERRARNDERIKRELLAMSLRELRKQVSGLTQMEVADLLSVTQGAISQLENREDMLFSNLADYVKVLGGELELVARFKNRDDVRITQFDRVKEQLAEATG